MPTNLSIKNVPEDIAERLKKRAALNHRSLQGELMAIIEAATLTPKYSAIEILEKARRLGMHSDESSVDFIRTDRDRDQPR